MATVKVTYLGHASFRFVSEKGTVIYFDAWLDENQAAARKPDMSDEQFYYKTRKYAMGPFKAQMYALPDGEKEKLSAAWEKQFDSLFDLMGVAGTSKYVDKFVQPVITQPDLEDYLGGEADDDDVSDLAD